MGKPGGFFKKLKQKQTRTAKKNSRGTEGASKAERKRKHNESVDFHAAQRLADQLDAISDSSSEAPSSDDELDALDTLRASLGVSNAAQTIIDDEELSDEEEELEELEEDEEMELRDELEEGDEVGSDVDDEEAQADDDDNEESDEESEVDQEDDFLDEEADANESNALLLEAYKLQGEDTVGEKKDPFIAKFHKDSHGLPDASACEQVRQEGDAVWSMSHHASKIASTLSGKHNKAGRPPFIHDSVWDLWCAYRKQLGLPPLTAEERSYFSALQQYSDLLDTTRTYDNSPRRRELVVLHILNHWFKASTICAHHDNLLKQEGEASDVQFRDQGFGKTRMLLCVPLRNSAKKYVEILQAMLGAETKNCHKLQMFYSDFSELEETIDPKFRRRPLDYRQQFEGNIDDSFCVGIRLQPTKFQVYSHVLNSDLIICSPVGLHRRAEKSGDVSVALSSIEVCVIDEAHVVLMQNWDQLTAMIGQLNKRPRDTTQGLNSLDRVYPWALQGKSGRHRQTVTISDLSHACFLTMLRSSKNNSGKCMLTANRVQGVLSKVMVPLRQHFLRFSASSVEQVDDERFDFFTSDVLKGKIYPLLERGVRTILFVPSYFDFVRLRKFLHQEYREFYAALSEYSSQREMRQALGMFSDGERSLLVMTERFYFFKRYFVKHAEVLAFYSPPLFEKFYAHLVGKLTVTPNSCVITAFCRYDAHELARLCGTERTTQLLTRESDAFSFVTQ